MTAIAVTIAGSDSGGGAGIQADLKTFSALGVYGASVITALTAQNTRGVTAIHDAPPEFIAAEIDAVFSDLAVGGVKIGMLSNAGVIETVAAGLDRWKVGNAVLDPVMIATSGDQLLADSAVETLRAVLLPRARLITPNLAEAARLLETGIAASPDEMLDQATALLALGPSAVLVKGGHGSGPEAADVLLSAEGARWFTAPRHVTENTHGTGCTLSAAIAAGLAHGMLLDEAVGAAKTYLTAAIIAADGLKVGHGHGPVHHFHRWW